MLLRLVVEADGRLRPPSVLRSSGAPELDRLALEASLEGAPYPSPPGATGGFRLDVPIEFRIR